MITQDRLKQVLFYDPDSGTFMWLVNLGNRNDLKGNIAGCLDNKGYLVIKIDQKRYYGSQLAFLYMIGRFARPVADHKDRNPSNTKWRNLREANWSQSNINQKPRGRSGIKGATWSERNQKWKALIRTGGNRIFLGYFDTKEAAGAAYAEAAVRHHGRFAYRDGSP